LVYLNAESEKISCLDSSVIGGHPHAIRVFSDTLVGVASERGVAFYRMREGANAPLLTSLGQWTTEGQALESWDLASDRWDRPWAIIGSNLVFADSLTDRQGNPLPIADRKFKVAEGFLGEECRVLEQDPLNTLWAGCSNGLFHIEPAPDGVGKTTRYTLDDGLLNHSIRDISVDPANGQVWIATDRGVSMLESRAQPPVAKLKTVKAYPNPFRPQHRYVIFDHLPLNATVRVHNSAGDVVRIIRPSDLAGSQAQWDGKNQDGKNVAPGVYLFSVAAGTSVERGKIIVAR
jgi:hypothetical protein